MLDIVALTVNGLAPLNVVAELPSDAARPILRIQEAGVFSPSSHMPDWLYENDLQFDTWGESKASAFGLLSQAFTALRAHPGNAHGQITRVEMVSSSYEPDPDWTANGQPGPRYVSIVRVHAHH